MAEGVIRFTLICAARHGVEQILRVLGADVQAAVFAIRLAPRKVLRCLTHPMTEQIRPSWMYKTRFFLSKMKACPCGLDHMAWHYSS
jgi:hypothetical protein